jgi:hypothetical protein
VDTGYPKLDSSSPEKALFRAAQALYHLGRFNECRETLQELCKPHPDNIQAADLLNRAKKRYSEQADGTYDFDMLHEEAKNLKVPQLDAATYVGPVEVRDTPNKGRGLFTTKAVKAGDLLLCEKAFEVYDQMDNKDDASVFFNVETKKVFPKDQIDLATKMVHKLARNPSLAKDLTKLYHGSYEGVDVTMVDGKPVIDT